MATIDVSSWLHGLGLEHYVGAFSENDIDGEVLPRLTGEDLLAIGVVSIGHRRRLLDAIAALRGGDTPAAVSPTDRRPEPRADTSIPALPEAERRQVTVLFADLAGYTALADELDAEEVHALLDRFFELVDSIVEGYGGRVDKHIGDCVMAVFGAPIAHGNDPERAVRAALEIQELMPGLAHELGRPIGAHIGVASGQVVASRTGSASRQEYTVTGDSVVLASRLTDRAASGETLISEAVHRALRDRLECAAVGELAVKGLAKPVRAWQLLGYRESARLGRQLFVGRNSELHQFEAALARCCGSGHGQAVYVRGEAGIGKTRLVEEFQHLAAKQGFACHCGLVLDFGTGTGQDAIRSVVRSLLGASSTRDPAFVEAAAKRAVSDGLIASERRVFLNDLLDMPQPMELRALYDAMDNSTRNSGKRATVAELVARASNQLPLLLVVEDLHWADRLTLDHLASLTEAVTECPALLVMTSRIEGDPLDNAWRPRIAGSSLLTVDLGPLRLQEAEALADTYLDGGGELARRCIERAAGNPLFLEQLLLNSEEGTEAASRVPGSIQSLVLARMDRLEALDKQALQAASVLGQRFTPDALHYLVERDFDCACLIRQCLVRPTGEDYLFAHALIQEAVYTSLLRGKRRGLHRRAATWFAGCDPVLHAEHLDRAEDPAAPQAYLEAARALKESFRYERALALVSRGLELVRDRAATFDLTSLQGELLRDLGNIERSIEAFDRALKVANTDRQRCLSWIGIAAGQRVVGRFDEALEILDRAEAVAARSDFADELAEIHHHRGNVYFPLGNLDGCLEQHQLALAQAKRAGSRHAEARALGGLGDAYYLRGRMVSARDQFDRCVGICRASGYVAIEAANLYMRGIARLCCNELPAGLEDGFAAAELAASIGQLRAEMVARGGVCALILYELGEFERSAEEAQKAWKLARRLGARQFEGNSRKHLGRGLTALGRRKEAAALLEEGIEVCRETGLRFMGPELLGALAVATDDPATRERVLTEGEAILLSGCPSHNYLFFYRDAIEASLAVGTWDEAERYAAALEEYTRSEPLPWADFVIARGCALAKWGRGQRESDTAAELERLAAEAERIGLRVGLPVLRQALDQHRGAH
jgi:class 3 adenylate cyclase/tetratricopeptide (TPR) repeat protein